MWVRQWTGRSSQLQTARQPGAGTAQTLHCVTLSLGRQGASGGQNYGTADANPKVGQLSGRQGRSGMVETGSRLGQEVDGGIPVPSPRSCGSNSPRVRWLVLWDLPSSGD